MPLAGCRDVSRLDPKDGEVHFHRGLAEVSRPKVVAVAAGAAHTICLTQGGVVLGWRSADPQLRPCEVGGALAGRKCIAVSAGRDRCAVVAEEGDVFVWEGVSAFQDPAGASTPIAVPLGSSPKASSPRFAAASPSSAVQSMGSLVKPPAAAAPTSGSKPPLAPGAPRTDKASIHKLKRTAEIRSVRPVRVPWVKKAASVAVGEKHFLVRTAWTAPELPSVYRGNAAAAVQAEGSGRRRDGRLDSVSLQVRGSSLLQSGFSTCRQGSDPMSTAVSFLQPSADLEFEAEVDDEIAWDYYAGGSSGGCPSPVH